VLIAQIQAERKRGMDRWQASSRPRCTDFVHPADGGGRGLGLIPIAGSVWGPMAYAMMGGLLIERV